MGSRLGSIADHGSTNMIDFTMTAENRK